MKRLLRPLAVLGLAAGVLSGCTGSYRTLALTPRVVPAQRPDRPADVPPAAELLANCAGVQFNPGTIAIECEDGQYLLVTRYDTEASTDPCTRITSRLMPVVDTRPGPVLRLPPGASTQMVRRRQSPAEQTVRVLPPAMVACVPDFEGGLLYLANQSEVPASDVIASQMISAIAYDGIPAEIVTSLQPDTLRFFGRQLPVDPSCSLMGTNNLACQFAGQMDWHRYSSLDAARTAQDEKVRLSIARGLKVIRDEMVPCTFEGVATDCRRVVYKMPFSRLLTLGASNVLVAVYAATEVRGQFAQATCSFYDDQLQIDGLAPLCAEAFDLTP